VTEIGRRGFAVGLVFLALVGAESIATAGPPLEGFNRGAIVLIDRSELPSPSEIVQKYNDAWRPHRASLISATGKSFVLNCGEGRATFTLIDQRLPEL
jgi:hypothetical protein